jgi:hypothetical protein
MVVAAGFGRAVVLGAACGVGGFAAAGGGLEGRIVIAGGGGEALVTVGSTAGRIVIGGDAIGSGAAVVDVAAVAGEGGGTGAGAGAVGSSGTTGATLAGMGASTVAAGARAAGVTGAPPLVANQTPTPPPITARAPRPTQSPVLDRRANDGTTPSISIDARRGRVLGIAGATRRALGECDDVGTETAIGTWIGTGIGRDAPLAGGMPPSTITDSWGSTDTVAFGRAWEPFVAWTSAFTSARASFACSARMSLAVMLEAPVNGASSSCQEGRNDAESRSKSSAVGSGERSFPLESDGSLGYDIAVRSLPPGLARNKGRTAQQRRWQHSRRRDAHK